MIRVFGYFAILRNTSNLNLISLHQKVKNEGKHGQKELEM